MIHLVYESAASKDVSQAELVPILEHARRRNAADGITGMLLFHDGTFLQVLEGPEDKVEACFDRIKRDPRHGDMWVLAKMPASRRAFQKWSMALGTVEDMPEDLKPVLRDFSRLRKRLRRFGKRNPEGAAAYTGRIITRFLDTMHNRSWT